MQDFRRSRPQALSARLFPELSRGPVGAQSDFDSIVNTRNAATAYLPSLTQNLPPKPAGYQFIAKKYMKKGVFYAFGIGVAE